MSGTIYALSSAPGRAGVAVVRVSGPAARAVAERLGGALSPPRQAVLRALRASDGAAIDAALVLWFPGPASFTGEDVVEFHVHGGRAVVERLSAEIAKVPGTRPAEPGAFTRRAVENGKLDLTQAEALIDLIDAETESQRRQALGQYGGTLREIYEGWRERLVRALAWAGKRRSISPPKNCRAIWMHGLFGKHLICIVKFSRIWPTTGGARSFAMASS
ncbi:MAG: hypothetical protein WDM81_00420 [Rhizomicrobium sp.]